MASLASADTADRFHTLTLAGLAGALDRGEVSSLAATEWALERIARLDGRNGLNAFITVTADAARVSARAADERRAAGTPRGPLDGVPIALKDLFDTAGTLTTAGARIWNDRVPNVDAAVVSRLQGAGAVIVGKTNMLEFAYGYPHPDFGETVNPWDRTRTAGGSSGGSAAAVATRMAWGALGSDTGGSVRSPAAYCGVTGLKPTAGLVSMTGVAPLSTSLDHTGPMAQTAEDCALLLAAIAGHDPTDPASASRDEAERALVALGGLNSGAVRTPLTSLAGVRIGAVAPLFASAVTPGLAQLAAASTQVFADLGATVAEVDLPSGVLELVVPALVRIYAVEAAAVHRDHLPTRADDFGPTMRMGLERAMDALAVDYVDAQRDRLRVRTAFDAMYERFDLLVWPAQPMVAPPLGTTADAIDGLETSTPTIEVEIGATGPANLTGEPSLSIPCGLLNGLPVGLLVQGPRFADARVLAAAMAYQASVGVPPLP